MKITMKNEKIIKVLVADNSEFAKKQSERLFRE